jgi:chromosome segregation ATPase
VVGDGGVSVVREAQALRNENVRLQGLLEASQSDVESLTAQLKQVRDQLADARKDLKGEQDRLRNLEKRFAPEMDPTSSETAFLQAVRVAYARLLNEHDR